MARLCRASHDVDGPAFRSRGEAGLTPSVENLGGRIIFLSTRLRGWIFSSDGKTPPRAVVSTRKCCSWAAVVVYVCTKPEMREDAGLRGRSSQWREGGEHA